MQPCGELRSEEATHFFCISHTTLYEQMCDYRIEF